MYEKNFDRGSKKSPISTVTPTWSLQVKRPRKDGTMVIFNEYGRGSGQTEVGTSSRKISTNFKKRQQWSKNYRILHSAFRVGSTLYGRTLNSGTKSYQRPQIWTRTMNNLRVVFSKWSCSGRKLPRKYSQKDKRLSIRPRQRGKTKTIGREENYKKMALQTFMIYGWIKFKWQFKIWVGDSSAINRNIAEICIVVAAEKQEQSHNSKIFRKSRKLRAVLINLEQTRQRFKQNIRR